MLFLTSLKLEEQEIESIVIPVCEDKNIHKDPQISRLAQKAVKYPGFKGKNKDELILYDLPGIKTAIFIGMGKTTEIDGSTLRNFAGKAVKTCIQKGLSYVCISIPREKVFKLNMQDIISAVMEGAVLGNHIFDKYKKEKKKKPLKKINIITSPDNVKKFTSLPAKITAVCSGTIMAREWVSLPSNHKKPEQFVKIVSSIAKKEGIEVTILDKKALENENFEAMLSVAAGSPAMPYLMILSYMPQSRGKTFAIVGKGVTFDSGGVNLKPGSGLEGMKADMAGAAAAAATIITLAKLKSKTNVIAALPLVENMVSGTASRPGDIVRSHSGKTIEINNTDAEGRLILVDTISYIIEKYAPDTLIDLATLTGACVVALGEHIAGVFSKDEKLSKDIIKAGEKTRETCWALPLFDNYKEMLKSDFADISNVSSSRWGGAITAALFISEFVKDVKWAHIDIAGPAYAKKEDSYCGPGGTGFGVRLLTELLKK